MTLPLTGLNFVDLTLKEIPVTIGAEQYVLREANGDASCKYRNKQMSCAQLGPDGRPVKMIGMADCDPFLVSMCLFNSSGKPVSEQKVRSWPVQIQIELAKAVKELSGMDSTDDLASLRKQRDDLDKRIRELEAGEEKPDPTMDGSD